MTRPGIQDKHKPNNAVAMLAEWIKAARHVVFFGGAGVSTESGVPDFRSAQGIYSQEQSGPDILTPRFMNSQPRAFYDFYRKYFLLDDIRPNTAHRVLARMEKAGLLACVITQNVDGLHQAAGSKRVIELHGSGLSFSCQRCGHVYDEAYVRGQSGVPYCEARRPDGTACGGMLRPDIVLYEESLNQSKMTAALREILASDLIIIGGTSLTVYPAASLLDYRQQGRLVLINRDPTVADQSADLVFRESIGKLFGQLEPLLFPE
ncbi:MAG: NAD-dependent protein deacylase [Oscillospiraceae bacterium]|nr:NAD-dependent protein deacylase [Oscillospiraceae bacterium]MDD4368471.1 NAD-dependent protein deacylase [Oscillospiraceae bacterium]